MIFLFKVGRFTKKELVTHDVVLVAMNNLYTSSLTTNI